MAKDNPTAQPMFTAEDVARISADAASSAVKAALEALGPKADTTPDEKFEAFVAGKSKNRPPHSETRIKCQCPDTKVKFTAVVVPSRTYPEGRIYTIEDHQYPPESLEFVSHGGHVPDGMHIKHPQTGQLDQNYKKWLTETYYLPILRLATLSARKLAPFRIDGAEPVTVTPPMSA